MKKILSAAQFAAWQKMDLERRRDDLRRQLDRQAIPDCQFDRESMPAHQ